MKSMWFGIQPLPTISLEWRISGIFTSSWSRARLKSIKFLRIPLLQLVHTIQKILCLLCKSVYNCLRTDLNKVHLKLIQTFVIYFFLFFYRTRNFIKKKSACFCFFGPSNQRQCGCHWLLLCGQKWLKHC